LQEKGGQLLPSTGRRGAKKGVTEKGGGGEKGNCEDTLFSVFRGKGEDLSEIAGRKKKAGYY